MAITWKEYNGQMYPVFTQDMVGYTPGVMNDYGQQSAGSWGISNPYANTTLNDWWLTQQGVPEWLGSSTNAAFEGDASGLAAIKVKTADKEGTVVPYKLVDGQYVPDFENARVQGWDTNSNKEAWKAAPFIAAAAAPLLFPELAASMAGAEAGGIGAAAESFPVSMPGAVSSTPLGAAPGATVSSWGIVPSAAEFASSTVLPLEGLGYWSGNALLPTVSEMVAGSTTAAAPLELAVPGTTAAASPWANAAASVVGTGSAPFNVWDAVKAAPGKLLDYVTNDPLKALTQGATLAGLAGSLVESFKGNDTSGSGGGSGSVPYGWNDPLPKYSVTQQYAAPPEGYRPGFSPEHVYIRTAFNGKSLPPPPLTSTDGIASNMPVQEGPASFAQGGLAAARYIGGHGDGMSDSIQTSIDGQQPALLSRNEYVIPADAVSHLGNGSSEAGAEVLDGMVAKIRRARTGSSEQAPQIVAGKYLPI